MTDHDDATPHPRLGRRALLRTAAAGLAAAAVPTVDAGAQASDNAISAADIAVVDRLTGHDYFETERALMARTFRRTRADLEGLRAADLALLAEGSEPATHFDPRLPDTPLPRGRVRRNSARLSDAETPDYNGEPASLAFAPITTLARLLRARQVTSVALTRMYLDRLKRFGPRLNCVINLTEELALRQAEQADREIAAGRWRGPLHGVPWGAKDLLAARGYPTTFGAKPYEHQTFDHDATVVERLAAAGAVLVAKLSMGELAMGDVWFGGLTRNPWKPSTGSSGSSAGPGAATAAGLVGFAIGTETLGSIISPSTVNGVTGLRPTYGRVPRTGAMALCWTMDKLGPMARSVEDCALALDAIHGPDNRDLSVADVPFRWEPEAKLSGLRVGMDVAAFEAVAKNAKRKPIYDAVLNTLRGLGARLTPISLPKDQYGNVAPTIIDCESSAAFARLNAAGKLGELAQQGPSNWPNTFRVGSLVPAADYLTALRLRARLQRDMADALREVDCYVTVPFASNDLYYTNLTGHPSLATRCGMLDGLPQTVVFTGALYREDAILRLALAYERATPFHTQWPDTNALPPTPPPVERSA